MQPAAAVTRWKLVQRWQTTYIWTSAPAVTPFIRASKRPSILAVVLRSSVSDLPSAPVPAASSAVHRHGWLAVVFGAVNQNCPISDGSLGHNSPGFKRRPNQERKKERNLLFLCLTLGSGVNPKIGQNKSTARISSFVELPLSLAGAGSGANSAKKTSSMPDELLR